MAKSEKPFDAVPLLEKFAAMAKKSKAYDGDWQGDGGGVAWVEKNEWKVRKSMSPIWESIDSFSDLPSINYIVMHARSASFPQHKNNIEYNQPFIYKNYAFVFNGLLKGVTLPYQLEGTIGVQKIWSLLQKFLKDYSPKESLKKTVKTLNNHTRIVQALNIGLADKKNFFAFTQFNSYPDYYNLRINHGAEISVICSEEIEGVKFEKIDKEKVKVL